METNEEPRHVRLARNQALFRSVNERTKEINASFEDILGTHLYACECADVVCIEQIEVEPKDYAAVRRDPRRFLVAPDDTHVYPDVEAVVERTARWWVVEKVGVAAEVVLAGAAGSS